ncbi:helix-turn-helix domain-containing protein [Acidithiobacillus caldus]|uniref:transcriptional regulator n=1 Tax=Acidithiobacillus caldus TaxID=33059 RepID=UPI0007D90CF9|nr:Cro/CI family transcriptional regulator [Acidithiobacillus caldus]AUW32603.1 helix-turn-helix domain-containing protein [Acidithiobacillus caldus]QER44686.1 hypothetical protein F0726_01617 [Acidithiobacillus caldus]
MKDHVLRAIAHFGSQSALAKATGLSQAAVSKWVRGLDRVSPRSAIAIQRATNGLVTKEQLCPDIFDDASNREDQQGAA